ncbi:hypothetical protein CBA19CS11_02150 [Caballeronia novacaledonica]|uniref:hypothetical protein n=1 Tax=Caballeronia novacaledonica TaxID=1544861 RepID=UPI001EE392AC|nr:hypothetical protein [Caballeronia novacaledonica]GJH07590.1 hypothetical protein CBA19CS11_02150 [Caballeronia novacaledonica]
MLFMVCLGYLTVSGDYPIGDPHSKHGDEAENCPSFGNDALLGVTEEIMQRVSKVLHARADNTSKNNKNNAPMSGALLRS